MAGRKRHDPVSRPADGRRPYGEVLNRDPGRQYVWTNPNDEQTGTESYKAAGFEVETRRADGPRAAIGKAIAEGEAITTNGQILVSRPIEEKEAEDAAGWAIADGWDRRILKDGNVEDRLRGRGVSLGVDRRETSSFETEHGA